MSQRDVVEVLAESLYFQTGQLLSGSLDVFESSVDEMVRFDDFYLLSKKDRRIFYAVAEELSLAISPLFDVRDKRAELYQFLPLDFREFFESSLFESRILGKRLIRAVKCLSLVHSFSDFRCVNYSCIKFGSSDCILSRMRVMIEKEMSNPT